MSDEQTEQPQDDPKAEEEPEQPDKGGEEPDYKAEFEKWKAMARKHEQQAKANADKAKRLDEMEEASKSEQQKLSDQASEAEKRAAEAEARALRYEVATDKGVPREAMKFLTGTTQEELAEQADEILALIGGNDDKPGSRKPRERLKPGAAPDSEPEPDHRKLAESILGENRI